MFQKIKQKLINKDKIGSYLTYAVGEIILIVIGILVAVSINNWNREVQQKKLRHGIFEVIINDIKSDTAEVNRILEFYEGRKATFERIAKDTLTESEIRECNLCTRIIVGRRLFSINGRGFSQLNEYQNVTSDSRIL